MPALREGDRFLVDLVEGSEVEMMRDGCRAARVWRVSELRRLDGIEIRGAARQDWRGAGGALRGVDSTRLSLATIRWLGESSS